MRARSVNTIEIEPTRYIVAASAGTLSAGRAKPKSRDQIGLPLATTATATAGIPFVAISCITIGASASSNGADGV